MYFDQRTGDLHAIGWLKSSFSTLKTSVSITNGKKISAKEEKNKYQYLTATPKRWQTPRSWSTQSVSLGVNQQLRVAPKRW